MVKLLLALFNFIIVKLIDKYEQAFCILPHDIFILKAAGSPNLSIDIQMVVCIIWISKNVKKIQIKEETHPQPLI